MRVETLETRVDALIAESHFSGVIRVDQAGEVLFERSAGWAHRAHKIPMNTSEGQRYGLGFWLHSKGPGVMLEGYDAGVSFRAVHDPESDTTLTVISNWTNGAWPVTRALDRDLLGW